MQLRCMYQARQSLLVAEIITKIHEELNELLLSKSRVENGKKNRT